MCFGGVPHPELDFINLFWVWAILVEHDQVWTCFFLPNSGGEFPVPQIRGVF